MIEHTHTHTHTHTLRVAKSSQTSETLSWNSLIKENLQETQWFVRSARLTLNLFPMDHGRSDDHHPEVFQRTGEKHHRDSNVFDHFFCHTNCVEKVSSISLQESDPTCQQLSSHFVTDKPSNRVRHHRRHQREKFWRKLYQSLNARTTSLVNKGRFPEETGAVHFRF